jgi:hypothetical protein
MSAVRGDLLFLRRSQAGFLATNMILPELVDGRCPSDLLPHDYLMVLMVSIDEIGE